jgi:N-acetyl-gamma-glutamyl-phosphate reductase
MTKLNVAILGASGYTGAELVRLLSHHSGVTLAALTADRKAGQSLADTFPHLGGLALPGLVSISEVDFSKIDVVFCALPHGTTQEVILALPQSVRIIDLSADFRLYDCPTYARWYGHEHQAPDLQKDAVYGLTEFAREQVKNARLVANPGCYPTASQLPLIPLLKAGAIAPDFIIIDAKSGASGAGRAAKEANLFCEVTEGLHAYGIGSHRHLPEIEQGLSMAAGHPVQVSFTPHLMPMSRGMLATIYIKTNDGLKAQDLHAILSDHFAHEPFVRVLDKGQSPATRNVRGSNFCHINVFDDPIAGRAVIVSVIDNLVKGASGQAIQNFNLMAGFAETTALHQHPLFP